MEARENSFFKIDFLLWGFGRIEFVFLLANDLWGVGERLHTRRLQIDQLRVSVLSLEPFSAGEGGFCQIGRRWENVVLEELHPISGNRKN